VFITRHIILDIRYRRYCIRRKNNKRTTPAEEQPQEKRERRPQTEAVFGERTTKTKREKKREREGNVEKTGKAKNTNSFTFYFCGSIIHREVGRKRR
jgi:hypothetical protein